MNGLAWLPGKLGIWKSAAPVLVLCRPRNSCRSFVLIMKNGKIYKNSLH